MAIIQRFSTIGRGGIIFTGNTAGLAPVNATSRRYGTRHGVGRIFGKCDTCAHLQSVVAVVGHQPCRLTLAVVYEDSSQPLRSLTLWCGA